MKKKRGPGRPRQFGKRDREIARRLLEIQSSTCVGAEFGLTRQRINKIAEDLGLEVRWVKMSDIGKGRRSR